MQKDLKIGMVLGLILVAAVGLWLSIHPKLSVESRIQATHKTRPLTPRTAVSAEPDIMSPPQIESSEVRDANNEQPDTKFHIVQAGETLSSISIKYYGSANSWQKILNANTNTIKDPRKLTPGIKLTIPE